MKPSRFFLCKTFVLAILSGCATTNRPTDYPGRFDQVIKENTKELIAFKQEEKDSILAVKPENTSLIASENGGCFQTKSPATEDKCPYKQEAKYLNHWPPKVGLSLSGGGVRAASFGIGVMKALNDAEQLAKIDLISSVSGGSYANYWYFSQKFYMDRLSKMKNPPKFYRDIFKTWENTGNNLEEPNKYRFQRTLEESSEILGFAHKPSFFKDTFVSLQLGFEGLIQGLSIPVNWIANGLFDWEVNVTPFYYYYKDGIDRTYGYVPLDYTLDHFANAKEAFGWVDNIDAEPILLSDMKKFLEEPSKEKKPYFIINTAARFGNRMDKDGKGKERNMESSLFEFTPWGCHSELLNFHPGMAKELIKDCPLKDFHLEINREVGTKELDLARIVTASGAAVDGQAQFVDVSGREEEAYQLFGTNETFLEIGLDILNFNLGYTTQNQNTSDAQRILHKFMPWPLYLVHDYILQDSATSVHLSDGGHTENLGILPLIRRGTEHIILVDAEQDPDSTFSSAKRVEQTLKRHGLHMKPCDENSRINVHDIYNELENAISEWEIVRESGASLEKPIHITYLKLAAPSKYEQTGKALPYSVISYLRENHDFPHESTMDLFYSPEQFRAYRDLGYAIAIKRFHMIQ